MVAFPGRGDVIPVRPLSFAEFLPAHGGEKAEAWESYATFGGMPAAALMSSDAEKERYLDYPSKWYATDVGLRNARLNFRQMEPTHIQENVLYNELAGRGRSVDVGVVPVETRTGGVYSKTNHEIDFVLNRGFRRVYLQSAFRMDDPEKRERELLPLLKGETRGIKKNPENIGIFACFRGKMNGGKGGSRTHDTGIFSPLLYH